MEQINNNDNDFHNDNINDNDKENEVEVDENNDNDREDCDSVFSMISQVSNWSWDLMDYTTASINNNNEI